MMCLYIGVFIFINSGSTTWR